MFEAVHTKNSEIYCEPPSLNLDTLKIRVNWKVAEEPIKVLFLQKPHLPRCRLEEDPCEEGREGGGVSGE